MSKDINKISGREGDAFQTAGEVYVQIFRGGSGLLSLGAHGYFRGAELEIGAAVALIVEDMQAIQRFLTFFASEFERGGIRSLQTGQKTQMIRIDEAGAGRLSVSLPLPVRR